jgi:hypothetical protein
MICRSCCTPHSCRDISSVVDEVSVMEAGDGGGGGSERSIMARMSRWISVRSCTFSSCDVYYAARRSWFTRFVTSNRCMRWFSMFSIARRLVETLWVEVLVSVAMLLTLLRMLTSCTETT